MFVSDCISVDEKGHLTIGGMDTVELAKEFGTPCFVMDEQRIRKNCRAYVDSIQKNYDGNGLVTYASKAFCCKEICRIVTEEGLGLDVVSGGEIYTALSAGVKAEKLHFHGNNKTPEELEYAVSNGVGRIIVDNLFELEMLSRIAAQSNKTVNILLRIKPGIDAHTHDFIRTGQIDSKFGLAIETGEAMQGVEAALKAENICLKGLHCHIGSQIFDVDPFELAAEVMIDFIADVKAKTGFEAQELDLGGGFGIKYKSSDNPLAYEEYMAKVATVLKKKCAERQVKTPFVLIEPGRSVTGSAGLTLYTVGAVKTIPEVRTYVSIDGGMGDNPRYILYQAEYEILCASKANEPKTQIVTLAGRCCESGDLIQENAPIQPVEAGDVVAVLSTGAYNYSMASNYNRIPRPPVVMVNNGRARVIVRRESYEDIIKNDI
ncbi:MAG TPA: diaminopimelate decarboxylase [Ruminococcaceae bacterium]|nr:diaminopimelate decarboxylase [Oscillospiraceae bacterium]